MAWKRKSTSRDLAIDVDLSSFEPDQLLQGLIDADLIDQDEAEKILARERMEHWGTPAPVKAVLNETDLELAIVEANRGRIGEAIIHLERAAGLEGVLTPHFRA